jgi:hypothetical protein
MWRKVWRHRSAEERTRKQKEHLSNGLIVKEWQVESTEGDQDDPPPWETVEAPQPPASTTNSFPVSCVILESEDCESLAGRRWQIVLYAEVTSSRNNLSANPTTHHVDTSSIKTAWWIGS